MKNVLHIVRKNTQLKASFIFNQINTHLLFKPSIVFLENRNKINDGGFADFNLDKVNYLNLNNKLTFISRIKNKFTKKLTKNQINKIVGFIEDNKINVLHFHYGSDCGVFQPLLKHTQIPSVVSFYGYDCSSFPKLFLGLGKWYLKTRVFSKVTKVLAMSPDMKQDLMKAGCPEEKIIVHYYGTDTSLFYYKKSYPIKENITILILASLVPQKGHLFLLKSIKKLLEDNIVNFNLRIVGTGELENELKTFCIENKLSNHVTFTGAIKYASPEMFQEFREADVFVHPSVIAPNGDKEGIPGTIIEAMASGLPVVSTFHAGIPYIIENNKTGILVKEHDEHALKESILKLIHNNSLRQQIGLAGQEYALEKLDLKTKELELENIYEALILNEN